MMLHQDGSRHAWLEGQGAFDLIVTMDDAMGAIYSAFLVAEVGTASTFQALKEVFGRTGSTANRSDANSAGRGIPRDRQ